MFDGSGRYSQLLRRKGTRNLRMQNETFGIGIGAEFTMKITRLLLIGTVGTVHIYVLAHLRALVDLFAVRSSSDRFLKREKRD